MPGPSRPLTLRLLLALSLPGAGCWMVDTRSEVVEGVPDEKGNCRAKDDPLLYVRVEPGSRCSPKQLESVDEGPVVERTSRGEVRCLYLVTVSQTQKPTFCISSGRPLMVGGVAVLAPLRRGASA